MVRKRSRGDAHRGGLAGLRHLKGIRRGLMRRLWSSAACVGVPIPAGKIDIEGFLKPIERGLLARYAREVPRGGTIVEIGTYKGLSSVIMALNSRHATVYCIDPLDGRGDTASSGYEQVDLRPIVRANHVRYGVRNCAVIATTSREARAGWKRRIDLLFVDGSHDYADVSFDVNEWGVLVKPGAHMIMDDATPISSKPGVIRAAREALASPRWLKVEEAGACLVLRRQRDDQQGGSSR